MTTGRGIVIGGHERSGTSLVRRAFAAHPDVAMFEWDWPLMTAIHARYHGRIPSDDKGRRRFAREAFDHPKFLNSGLSRQRDELIADVHSGRHERVVDLLADVLRRVADEAGVAVGGMKTPGMERNFGELIDVLDVHAVYVVRNPVDVATSAYAYSDWNRPPSEVALSWRRSVRWAEEARARFPAQVTFVKYEDLVGDPAGILGTLFESVGLSYAAAVVSETVFGKTNSSFASSDYDRQKLRRRSEAAVATLIRPASERYGYRQPGRPGVGMRAVVLANAVGCTSTAVAHRLVGSLIRAAGR